MKSKGGLVKYEYTIIPTFQSLWSEYIDLGKRLRRRLVALKQDFMRRRNAVSFKELYKHLFRILEGYYNYFGFAGNSLTLNKFSYAVRRIWFKFLNRRSQRKSFNWAEFIELLKIYSLSQPRIRKTYKWIHLRHK